MGNCVMKTINNKHADLDQTLIYHHWPVESVDWASDKSHTLSADRIRHCANSLENKTVDKVNELAQRPSNSNRNLIGLWPFESGGFWIKVVAGRSPRYKLSRYKSEKDFDFIFRIYLILSAELIRELTALLCEKFSLCFSVFLLIK